MNITQFRAEAFKIKNPKPKVMHCISCSRALTVPTNIKILGDCSINMKCKCGRMNSYAKKDS